MKDKKQLESNRRRTKSGVPVYRENPFWEPYEIKMGKKFIRIAGGTLHQDGEIMGKAAGVHIIEEKDEEEFVKLYTANMKVFFNISAATQKVLMIVLDLLQKTPNADLVVLHWIHAEDYAKTHNILIGIRSFQRALKELIEKNFLAESLIPHQYWINPHLFFNGDRMVFIKEYRKMGMKRSLENQVLLDNKNDNKNDNN